MSNERRTWNTPHRADWNPRIHAHLQAIDCHVQLYLREGDPRHLVLAEQLRQYVRDLKDYIHDVEASHKAPG